MFSFTCLSWISPQDPVSISAWVLWYQRNPAGTPMSIPFSLMAFDEAILPFIVSLPPVLHKCFSKIWPNLFPNKESWKKTQPLNNVQTILSNCCSWFKTISYWQKNSSKAYLLWFNLQFLVLHHINYFAEVYKDTDMVEKVQRRPESWSGCWCTSPVTTGWERWDCPAWRRFQDDLIVASQYLTGAYGKLEMNSWPRACIDKEARFLNWKRIGLDEMLELNSLL